MRGDEQTMVADVNRAETLRPTQRSSSDLNLFFFKYE